MYSCVFLISLSALTDPSTLLAHEVAYVLGQMLNPSAVPALAQTLRDTKLHPMVRHEVTVPFVFFLIILGR